MIATPLAFAALLALTVPAASASAAETVAAPTSCSFAQTNSGPGVRQGVTFVAPSGSDVLASFNLAVRNAGPVGMANEFTVQVQRWDATAGAATGPVIVESAAVAAPGFAPTDAWTGQVGMGSPAVIPGATYVAHVPSVGSAGVNLALCLAAAPLAGSAMVVYDPGIGWSAPPVMVPPGFSAVFLRQPRVTSVTAQAYPGETVTVTGSGFDPVLTTAVTIGGAPAAFTVVSPTVIEAVVPAGHPAGPADVQVTSDTLLSTLSTASQVLVLAPAAPASVTLGPPVIEPAAGSGPLADGAEGARGSLLPATGPTGSTGAAILAALALVGGGAALAVAARRGRHGIPVAPIGAGGAHLWHDEH